MATIRRRSDRGGRWQVRYRDDKGAQRARLFDRKVDAERFASTTTADIARGLYVDPALGRLSFAEYAQRWRAAQVHRPSTAAKLASDLRNHVLPFFGERPISSVRPSEVQAWVKGRAEVLAPATVEVIYRYLAAIFAAAVDDRLIATSPCGRKVKLPRREEGPVVPLAVDAVRRLADAVPARYRALVVMAAGTGLRQGECFGVTLDRVDFLRRLVVVDRQLVLLPGGPPRFAPPKTDASRRTVPLPGIVLDELARHLSVFPAGPEGLVFTADDGVGVRRNRFGEVWRRAVAAAGLPVGTHFHDLRHFYASLLIAHGESVKVVQARLGHKTAAETLDTYGHLWPDSEEATRAAVDVVLGSSCAPDVHQTIPLNQ